MTLVRIFAAGLIGTLSAMAMAQSALPAGHPNIAGEKPASRPSNVPAGHPDISGMGGMGGMGHGTMTSRTPTTQGATSGTIAIRAVQGTKGGPAVAGDAVVVELYHRHQVLKKFEAKLGADGTVIIDNVPVMLPVQPVIRIAHAGVEYTEVPEAMDGQHAARQVDVTLYETTEEAPAWRVQMRHVMIKRTPEGLDVTEMIAIENPSDRTWLGKAEADGKRSTVALDFPANAEQLAAMEGFVRAADRRLVNTAALTPGVSQFQFKYLISMKDGSANVAMSLPVEVQHMMMFLPEEGLTAKVEGLEAMGSHDIGRGKVLVFKGEGLKAAQPITISVQAAKVEKKPAVGPVGASSSSMPKIVAGVGGGLIVAVGAGMILMKSPKKAEA